MTGISSFRTSHANGFTLIELLVVMTIMALVAAIAVRQFGMPSGLGLRRDRQEALAVVRKARLEAQMGGKVVALGSKDLPSGSSFIGAGGTPVSALTFYSDGSASGGSVAVGGKAQIDVSWISGFAHVRS